jgi:hypothetical protein
MQQIGMSEYAQRFAENGIDFAILPNWPISISHLNNLGIARLPRARLFGVSARHVACGSA